MPGVNIYLNSEAFRAYRRLKEYVERINRERGSKLSVSWIIGQLLIRLVEKLSKGEIKSFEQVLGACK